MLLKIYPCLGRTAFDRVGVLTDLTLQDNHIHSGNEQAPISNIETLQERKHKILFQIDRLIEPIDKSVAASVQFHHLGAIVFCSGAPGVIGVSFQHIPVLVKRGTVRNKDAPVEFKNLTGMRCVKVRKELANFFAPHEVKFDCKKTCLNSHPKMLPRANLHHTAFQAGVFGFLHLRENFPTTATLHNMTMYPLCLDSHSMHLSNIHSKMQKFDFSVTVSIPEYF